MELVSADPEVNQTNRYIGKYPGKVVQNSKLDGDDTHLGMLLIEVPGILEESPDGEGYRSLQTWAKPCFTPGFFFLPEVGAPVWVEFAAGSIDEALWTGVWYPEGEVPETADEKRRIIRVPIGDNDALIIKIDGSKNEIFIGNTKNSITICENGITIKTTSLKVDGGTAGTVVIEGTTITGKPTVEEAQ